MSASNLPPSQPLDADGGASRGGFDAGVYAVDEVWKMRNGSRAKVAQRDGSIAVGTIDGSDAVHTWIQGKTYAGRGYDLIELLASKQPGICPAEAEMKEDSDG